MYKLKNIEKNFGTFSLRISDCCLERGYTYVITGPNGCGKTTFLNILALIEEPLKGDLFFKGDRINYSNQGVLLMNRRRIGYLMQDPYLFDMSVYENIRYGLKIRKLSEKLIQKKVDEIISLFFLSCIAQRNPRSLSGGEAQRVALARTLVLDAEVFLLDEPTANVDKGNIRAIESRILSLNKEKKVTVVLTTHSQDQAYRVSQNIISIIGGQIKNIAYENVFSGVLEEEKDGLEALSLTDKVKLKLSHGEKGPVTVAVAPQDIILSLEKFHSSALNKLYGTITKVEDVNGSLRVFVDTGVELCALVTRRSFYDMGLNIGKKVWATFKANSIKVI